MDRFVQRFSTSEEALPAAWKTAPLPKGPTKRPVGRPSKRKSPEDNAPEPSPKQPCQERLMVGDDNVMPKKRGGYKLHDTKMKKEVMSFARLHGTRAAARHFKISKSTVSEWLKTDFDNGEQRTKKGHLAHSGRPLTYSDDIEQRLLSYVLEQRDLQLAISVDDLCNLAGDEISQDHPEFKASRHWAERFMARNDLVLRAKTSVSQKLPADLEEKISSFHEFVKKQRHEDEFDNRLIVNMDETPMYFNMVPTKAIDSVGAKTVRVRTTASDKRHLTIILACAASGDMLPPMIIFKGKRDLDFPVPKGWVVTVQEKGWVDERIMLRWIKEILIPHTEKDRTLLVLDSFQAHITDCVKKLLRKSNVVSAVIPGGCTSKIQPLDISINKPFKAELRKCWTAYMRTAVRTAVESKEKVKAASKPQVVEWIENTFKFISGNRTLVKKSFLVCGISNSLSGAEDTCIRNESVIEEACTDNMCSCLLDSDNDDEKFEGFDPIDLIE